MELEKVQAYNHVNQFPEEVKKNQIYVDFKRESVLLPVNGQHVPIHISVLKNVSKIDENKTISLRLNFHIPEG